MIMLENKKEIVLFLLLIINFNSFSQNESKVKELIQNLSWSSFYFQINYGTALILNDDSKELIEIGKSCSTDLLEELKTTEKSVVIHMILTKIWEPEVFFWKQHFNENKENEEWNFTEYSLNNLSWYEYKDKSSIDPFEINRIYNYWKNRIE
ncbi:hypothetical protein [Polaribacter dokdonensis]|nr:hypothetical protein [Polaribacter dokdonensis]